MIIERCPLVCFESVTRNYKPVNYTDVGQTTSKRRPRDLKFNNKTTTHPLTRELSSETLMTYITNTFPNRFNSSSFYGAPTCLNPYCEKMKPGVGGSRSVFGESVKTLTTPCRGKFQRSFVRGVVVRDLSFRGFIVTGIIHKKLSKS